MKTGAGTGYRGRISFVLDGRVIEVDDVAPDRTVLQFLREDLGRTGTKEGCAEGDCGACTVAIAEIDRDGKRLSVRAVNACIQLLPTLDGKELITVESLDNGGLHPVQQAMVECHGSQCGFCTPGFVMSLFTMYKNIRAPDRRDIDDALAGNLCRCTGYRPIISAAERMYELAPEDGGWLRLPAGTRPCADEDERVDRLRSISTPNTLCVDHVGQLFYAPRTPDELAALLLDHPDATLLAGGTDVGLWITKDHYRPEVVVYTGQVAALHGIEAGDDRIDIGAAASLADAIPVITARYPGLEEMFRRFASPPIRNVGTLAGNIANGSPIGDALPALLVLDAELVLRKGEARRTVPLDGFHAGYRQNILEPGEFIERVLIPVGPAEQQVACYKVSKRFDQDISSVCGAYRLLLADGCVREIDIAYGGMAEIPKRAVNCISALVGERWDEAAVERAIEALEADFDPISDMRAGALYRRRVAGNLLTRFYLETTGCAPGSIYSHGR